MADDVTLAVGVRSDRHALAGREPADLRLLEVRLHVGAVERHQRHQPRPGLEVLSGLDGFVADDAVERCLEGREGEVALGHGERGLQFAADLLGLDLLSFQHVDGGFGRGHDGGGAGDRGVRTVSVGASLVEPLLRPVGRAHEAVGAVELGRGAGRLGLGREELRLGLIDRRGARRDLSADARDRRVLSGDAGGGRLDGIVIVASVDPDENLTLLDHGVVGNRHERHVARDLGGEDRGVRLDVGIVRRDQEAALDEPAVALVAASAESHQQNQRQHDPLSAPPRRQDLARPSQARRWCRPLDGDRLEWRGSGHRRLAPGFDHSLLGHRKLLIASAND